MIDFQKYIQRYLDLIPFSDWLKEMGNSFDDTVAVYRSFTEEQGNYAYAEGKWTLKEVLQHIIDAERIYAYRALRFARQDKTVLPGWDEVSYGLTYDVKNRSTESLLQEFEAVRRSSVLFFTHLDVSQLSASGTANGNELSVELLGKLIVGHNIHHLNVIKERYISNLNLHP